MGGEQPPAESVDRRYPGAVGRLDRLPQRLQTGSVGLAHSRGELVADPSPQLIRGALREGERQDALDASLGLEGGGAEPVDEHARLPRPRPGAQEDVAVSPFDRRGLLVSPFGTHSSSSPSSDQGSSSGSPRSRRQIGWKVHQSGHLPPSGSRITVPEWIDSMISSVLVCASARTSSKVSSSRWSLGRASSPASW